MHQSTRSQRKPKVNFATDKPAECLFHLKVHLLDISPMIYRRVVVRGDTTIAELHHLIQIFMGWGNAHLHKFHIWGVDYGIRVPYGIYFRDDPCAVNIAGFGFKAGDKFSYVYDFGDYWQHELRIEKITPIDSKYTIPLCTSGKRACPIEDIGGPQAYKEAISEQWHWLFIKSPNIINDFLRTEDLSELREAFYDIPNWYIKHQPEFFDREKVNRIIARLHQEMYQEKGGCDFWKNFGIYNDEFYDW